MPRMLDHLLLLVRPSRATRRRCICFSSADALATDEEARVSVFTDECESYEAWSRRRGGAVDPSRSSDSSSFLTVSFHSDWIDADFVDWLRENVRQCKECDKHSLVEGICENVDCDHCSNLSGHQYLTWITDPQNSAPSAQSVGNRTFRKPQPPPLPCFCHDGARFHAVVNPANRKACPWHRANSSRPSLALSGFIASSRHCGAARPSFCTGQI